MYGLTMKRKRSNFIGPVYGYKKATSCKREVAILTKFRRVSYSTLLPVKSGINSTFREIMTILFDGEYR